MNVTDIGHRMEGFENSQPIPRVEDMQEALRFYVEQPGCRSASWGNEDSTSVNRDQAGIYPGRGGQRARHAGVWIGVEELEKLTEKLLAPGVAIQMEPTNLPWALEMDVEDPDGSVIRCRVGATAGKTIAEKERWS
jgi:predicted enzyme related to lactoylglutathione lyase